MDFKWHPDEPPPNIEAHSKVKLGVLRSYLRAYFDRLNSDPRRDVFKLDLVDGFAGGGTFTDNGQIVPGTPLIMLEEAEAAKERLNKIRSKHLSIECNFYFFDKEEAHIDHLRKALKDRGYNSDDDNIVVRNSSFEDKIDQTLRSIHNRQPRSARAIFLLDQTGYAQVNLALIARILQDVAASEVILTFAVDALINYLAPRQPVIKAVAPLQLTDSDIKNLIEHRDGSGGSALAQRFLRDHIRGVTQAPFDTPFFFRPEISRRALWFVHLSKHPIARNVMIEQHWNFQNGILHYGSGDLDMLGWDALRQSDNIPLFNFKEIDQQNMRKQLLKSIPDHIYAYVSEQPMSIETLKYIIANKTAARFSDIDWVIMELVRERELLIIDSEGRHRSRSVRNPRPNDQITLPPTLLFPSLSRRS